MNSQALDKAIKAAGTTVALARKVGVSPQLINHWKTRGVPAERVPSVCRAVDFQVQPHELRPDLPDLFPAPAESAQAA